MTKIIKVAMVFSKQLDYEFAAQEDRSAPRFRLAIPARLRPAGKKSLETVTNDISLTGFSVTILNPIPPKTLCWLTLPGQNAKPAQTVWWDKGILGCAFEGFLSADIMESLIERWGKPPHRLPPINQPH